MIDANMKPWLLEVNHAPSLATESPFDLKIKLKLVEDTLRLLNLSPQRKNVYITQQKKIFQQRILTGKTQKLSVAEKDEKRMHINSQRDIDEKEILGGFQLIFPLNEKLPSNLDEIKLYQNFL